MNRFEGYTEDTKLFLLECSVNNFMNKDIISTISYEFNLLPFEDCISDMKEIKYIVGEFSPLYSSLCNQIVISSQNKIIRHLNNKIAEFLPERDKNIINAMMNPISDIAQSAIDAMYLLGKFKMDFSVRYKYEQNLEALKLFSKKILLTRRSMNYDEWLLWQLNYKENELEQIKNKIFFEAEIQKELKFLEGLKKWRIFRSESQKLEQINEQEKCISQLKIKSDNEKKIEIEEKQNYINQLICRIEKIKL